MSAHSEPRLVVLLTLPPAVMTNISYQMEPVSNAQITPSHAQLPCGLMNVSMDSTYLKENVSPVEPEFKLVHPLLLQHV